MATVTFRQNTIRDLPYVGSRNRQCIYWDESFPGFGLRVFPNCRSSYVCTYRVLKRKRLATLGRSDILTLEQARRKARIYLGKVAAGDDPQYLVDAMIASGTVAALAATYIERHAKPKKRSWRNDESLLNRLLLPKLGPRLAASITSAHISQIHSDVGKNHKYAANRLVQVIRKMYNSASTWDMLPKEFRNPTRGIEPYAEQRRRRYVTPSELPTLAAAIDSDYNNFAIHAIWLLLLTGVRRNELLCAKWADVDWSERTLYIGKTKNGEAILAPLSHAAISRLKSVPIIKGNPFIICGKTANSHLSNLNSAWERIRKVAGFNDLRLHDLRRTVGSWLVKDGASLHLVGAVLNHKDHKTTAGYAYFQTADRQKVLDNHGHRILKIAGQVTAARREKERKLLQQLPPNIDQGVRRFSRQTIYEMVWSEPMTAVSKRLGISDVGLAKVCRKYDIPMPGRGYWSRQVVSENIERKPLSGEELSPDQELSFRTKRPEPQHQLSSRAA